MSVARPSPFDALLELAKRVERAPGGGLPASQRRKTDYWTGVGFQVVGQRCVAPMGIITEVLPEPVSTRLPGVKPWVRGVANVRGRLLPLIDLNMFLGEAPCSRGKVLVIEHGELYAGLMVEDIYGMQHFDTDCYEDGSPAPASNLGRYVRGAYRIERQEWLVFRPNRLINDAAFFEVAA